MNSVGHPFGPGPTATLSENSPRADAWRAIFGGLTVPIATARKQACVLPDGNAWVYWLDIGRIDSETMDRLIAHTQHQFVPSVPLSMVQEGLLAEGMPIKADDVSIVTSEHPEVLIAGLDAKIETLVQHENKRYRCRMSNDSTDIRQKLDMRPTLDVDRLMEPLRRKAEEDAKHGPADDAFYETPQHVRHTALDAVLGGIADRMDAQAGFASTPKVQTVDKPFNKLHMDFRVDIASILERSMHEPARYDIPAGASIGDVAIPAGNMTAQQVADLIGGTVIGPGTILGPSLVTHSAKSTIVFAADDRASEAIQHAANGFQSLSELLILGHIEDEQDIRSELSDADGLPPVLCSCLTDGTPLGPHCVHAREWPFRGDDGVQRVRKHGGAHTCPRRCGECAHGAHHFSEIDMQPVFDLSPESDSEYGEDEREERELLRKHPAHLAGCESWYECRHDDAWIEASDADDEDEDDDDSSMNECDECGEDYADCDCDPDSDDFDDDEDDDFDDEDGEDGDDEDDSPNEPSPHPNTQDVSSMLPSNDRQGTLVDVGSPTLPVAVPQWATKLARDILFSAQFLGLLGARVQNNVRFQWAPVIATWSIDVQSVVNAWLNTPQEEAKTAKNNVPPAVRALIDQANGMIGGDS